MRRTPCTRRHMTAASTTSKGVTYLELPDRKLAYIHTLAQPAAAAAAAAAADTTIMFCPGLMSDMQGRKPSALAAYAAAHGCSCVRFDYRGHGLSSGSFSDCHLGMWVDDALQVLDSVVQGQKIVIVGSSMGGWVALHLALQRPECVAALLLIAPAVDFTRTRWQQLPQGTKDELQDGGCVSLGSRYVEPGQDTVRMAFFTGAERLCLMQEPGSAPVGSIGVRCPVRMLHGMTDDVVLPAVSLALAPALAAEDVHVTLIKDGDHRLSRDEDLQLMLQTLGSLLPFNAC